MKTWRVSSKNGLSKRVLIVQAVYVSFSAMKHASTLTWNFNTNKKKTLVFTVFHHLYPWLQHDLTIHIIYIHDYSTILHYTTVALHHIKTLRSQDLSLPTFLDLFFFASCTFCLNSDSCLGFRASSSLAVSGTFSTLLSVISISKLYET